MTRMIAALVLVPCTAAAAGRSITIDASFPYYRDRSAESIVEEIKANGYDDVRMACVRESAINGALVKAFRDAGIKVWMLTFGNGTYSTADLPEGWKTWRMELREEAHPDGFTYLCPNNPGYRDWKKQQVAGALIAHPFFGLDIAEPFFPGYPGPEGKAYGCFCDACKTAFRKMYPDESRLPEFENPNSPSYWKTDRPLYEKWVGFRVASVVSFLDDLVNGKGGIRERCPDAKVATWTLGLDAPDQLARLRECEALDAAAIVRRVRPDMHVIQTHWPDWLKSDLPGDYALKYKPVADSIREVSPQMPLMLQTDIGSKPHMRRSRDWIRLAEETARRIGCESATHYEYHLGEYMYTEPPALVRVDREAGGLKLVFNKRLNSMQASNISNYSISSGRIDFASADGNIVRLSITGLEEGAVVTISGISDDDSRRFFRDRHACVMEEPVQAEVPAQDGPEPGAAGG